MTDKGLSERLRVWDLPGVRMVPRRAIQEMREAADALDAKDRHIEALAGALEPFSAMASEMCARNWNGSDAALELYGPRGEVKCKLTAGDFFNLRAALALIKKETTDGE